MKLSTKLVLIYALLLVLLSLTLSSCLFQKHTTKSSSSTDSTAYSKIENSNEKHQEEAWNNYLKNAESSSSGVSFHDTPCPDTSNKVILHVDGSIEAKGNIKDVWHNTKKEETKKDSGSKKVSESFKYINTTYTIKETITLNTTKQVERKPDYLGYVKIMAALLLIAFVVWKWAKIKLWVVNKAKGLFTNFFH